MESQGATYSKLRKDIESSDGWGVYWKIMSLWASHRIFKVNEQELMRLLAKHADFHGSLKPFGGTGDQDTWEVEYQECVRLLHNYVAAAKSLVDHTRNVARAVLKAKGLDAYQSRVDTTFKDEPLSRFVQDLRNYVQHQANPVLMKTVEFQEMRSGMQLSIKHIQGWSGWSAKAFSFISSCKDKIYIHDIVIRYSALVDGFQSWVVDHCRQANEVVLADLHAREQRWADFCKSQGIPHTKEEIAKLYQT